MSRAKGRQPRRGPSSDGPGVASSAPDISPEEASRGGREDRDIPGGREHLINPVVAPPTAPNAAPPRNQFRGTLAHGVQPDGQHWDRPRGRSGPAPLPTGKVVEAPVPVPVRIVQDDDRQPINLAFFDNVLVPIATAPEPVRLCNTDPRRTAVQLLNETPTTGAPVGTRIGSLDDVTAGRGALLPPAMGGYLELDTHDEIFAISADGNANRVSVILLTEKPGV